VCQFQRCMICRHNPSSRLTVVRYMQAATMDNGLGVSCLCKLCECLLRHLESWKEVFNGTSVAAGSGIAGECHMH